MDTFTKDISYNYNDDTGFCIIIDYKNYVNNPSALFKSVSSIIDALKFADETLISSFSTTVDHSFVLDSVEKGSIKVFLKHLLENIPDSALEELDVKKIIGHFLVLGKKKILEKMEEEEITELDSIEKLQIELYEEIEKTNILPLKNYNTIDTKKLLTSMNNISVAVNQMPEEVDVYYEVITPSSDNRNRYIVNRNFSIPEKLLEPEISYLGESTCVMTIKIKQPDYVSNAMWEFKYEGTSIDAKFEDIQWLYDFQNRKIDVRPKDSLKVNMRVISFHDENKTEIKRKYSILKVLEVIQFNPMDQLSIDDM
ncbi:hypothetical protein [Clostridium sp.]|uniref:hypothetical protein n=1 Tax=Clostridium sp. TaxID=1506 RepID=UPI00258D99DF|nr:hypothetical protein [Clostridium sp.]MDF2505603.1 hypothetical protein [Clostridium sp.]